MCAAAHAKTQLEMEMLDDKEKLEIGADEKQWAMFCHLASLVGFIIPFGGFLGPLVVWQMKKHNMPFVDDQGKESLNFQITMAIATIVALLLVFAVIGILLLSVIVVFQLVVVLMASLRANEGVAYRYPLSIRFIR